MSIESLGGKGANLITLRDAGFPVPPFVILGTDEYRAFVAQHHLDAVIAEAVRTCEPREASELIRAAFRRPIDADQRRRIAATVADLADRPVAVRSSATAEDLPEASFAGQQDTFLDVRGLDAICDATVECWSSLWTERAITYRARNDVPAGSVALAVVVQELVDADASGVLFTADPLTGRRDRTVVDAVFGLGEKLVSGQVTPDHFEVDADGSTIERTVQGDHSTLSDAQLASLVALGRRVADHYGSPQDIEWTRVGGTINLVQSRAITSLYPLPAGPDEALWFSFGAFQGMLEPITPLGQDALRLMLTGAASLFGATLDYRTIPFLVPAGERLWIRVDRMLRNGIGHRVLPAIAHGLDPNAAAIVKRFADDPAYAPIKGTSPRAAATLARTLAPVLPRLRHTLFAPTNARLRLERDVDAYLADLRVRLDAAANVTLPHLRLAARLRTLESAAPGAFRVLLPDFFPIMGPSVGMMQRLRTLASEAGLPDADAAAFTVLRSLPGNVTAEMDLELWATSRAIAADPAARAAVSTYDAADLAADYLAGTLAPAAQQAVASFLDRYGMRGVAEIDLGTPRWREGPEGLFRTLASYLTIDPDRAPDVTYAAGRREAEEAIERIAAASTPAKARQVRFIGSRIRAMFGARETPKFTLVRVLGMIRLALQASGRDLVAAGVLDDPDDVFLLRVEELHGAFGRRDLRPLVAERRAIRAREQRRTRIPIVLVGDGRTFYDAGIATDADLAGLGVSPGVVEGRARVVDDPRTSELQPGEIMVCRGTDPAWTPLFLTASGLVTEVGGLMTHGSVVAREYGLPAVVGVGGATEILRDGRRIRLDGTSGTITFLSLDDADAAAPSDG
ncbi:MAG TPA: PEP/pyruvate-binding domain-containing protein [Propioniciclava tarda]|nr:PEP/pyruvate-binding domain-containing protein [Propioniciclava tarda]HQD61107.1 PEP/pyruvate-binding domain-containing protein [Propioniciclava tarda]